MAGQICPWAVVCPPWDSSISKLLHSWTPYENSTVKLSERGTETKKLDHFIFMPLIPIAFLSYLSLLIEVHKYICSVIHFYLEINCSPFIKKKEGRDQERKLLLTHLISCYPLTPIPMESSQLDPGTSGLCYLLPQQKPQSSPQNALLCSTFVAIASKKSPCQMSGC